MRLIGRLFFWLAGLFVGGALLAVALSAIWVWAYAGAVDPPTTYLMLRDRLAGRVVEHRWVPMDDIARTMPRAVIASEDGGFCRHAGFDVGAITAAMSANIEGGKLRGGSTVTQQVAKNAFLWPERSWLRKGLEAWFTLLIEQLWTKRRIMEVYLNIVELAPGVHGVDAAARHHYDRPAATLTKRQAARLAAILPAPLKRDPNKLDAASKRMAKRIERWIPIMARDGHDRCLWRYR